MKKIFGVMKIIILLIMAFLTAGPLLFLIGGSLMGNGEINEYLAPVLSNSEGYAIWRWFPLYPTLRNLVGLCLDSPEFFQMFWNSMKLTAGILIGQFLIGMPAAWGLARYSFPGKKQIYMLYILLMMLPFQVTMLSEYLVLNRLEMMDSLAAIILPGIFSTFSVFLMHRFFTGIPEEVLEAARIDGAGEWKLFIHIGIPMGSSGILSALILQCLECFSMIEQL